MHKPFELFEAFDLLKHLLKYHHLRFPLCNATKERLFDDQLHVSGQRLLKISCHYDHQTDAIGDEGDDNGLFIKNKKQNKHCGYEFEANALLVEIMVILTDESFDSGALSDENTGSS